MKTHHIAIALAALFLLGGCEKVLDIDDSDANSIMVLNGVPQAGKRAFVNFTNTHFFLDSVGSHPVDGASVMLYINGAPTLHDSLSSCTYFFPDTLRPLDQVAIDINTPKGNVHAETYVPPFPRIKHGGRTVEWASPTFNLYWAPLRLSDSLGYAEYYNITVSVRDSGMRHEVWADRYRTIDTVSNSYFMFLGDVNDITASDVSPNGAIGDILYSGLMFTDRRIDGRTDYPVNLVIPIFKDTNEVVNDTQQFKHWYTVTVESITPARMRYLISVARSNSLGSMLAEQAQPYTNVTGALGIFAGSAKWTYTFYTDTLLRIETPDIPTTMPANLPRRQ